MDSVAAKADLGLVAIVESSSWGLEHAPFNAALAVMVLEACPRASVHVHGEASQLEAQQDVLRITRPSLLSRLTWHRLEVPAPHATGWKRLTGTARLLREVEASQGATPPDAVIFARATLSLIGLLKAKRLRPWRNQPVLVVFHELLAWLDGKQSPSRLGLLAALEAPHPCGLTYLVLSDVIRDHLHRAVPRLSGQVFSIEHPSLLGDVPKDEGTRPHRPSLRFGFVGGGRPAKGLTPFLDVVREVHERHPQVEFHLVGAAPRHLPDEALSGVVSSRLKLQVTEYVDRIRSLSHVIWLGDPTHYRLVASGSLADVIAIGVPVICQRGPLAEHLFRRFGDIGWLCDSATAVRDTVRDLVANFSSERDEAQRARLAHAAERLRPEAGAIGLRDILGRAPRLASAALS